MYEDENGAFAVETMQSNTEFEVSNNYGLSDIISKVRDCVKVFHFSPVKKDTLDQHVRSDHGKEIGVILECKTRWNSTFEMVERFLKIRVSLVKALADGSNIQFSGFLGRRASWP